jgi:hypothetical protein
MAMKSTCPYCNNTGAVVRERSPNGRTKCDSCFASKPHAEWDAAVAARASVPAEEPVAKEEEAPVQLSIVPADTDADTDADNPLKLATKRKTLTLASMLEVSLAPEVWERLQALDEMYGKLGARAVLSMLITDAYMDRLAAFREAEGE